MKRNKLILTAFIATLLAGSAQVMATDQQRTRDQLNLDCNECQSLFDDSTAIRDQVRDREPTHDHVATQDGVQTKNQYRYQNTENNSFQGVGDGSRSGGSDESMGDSSNSGSGGGMGKGKGRH